MKKNRFFAFATLLMCGLFYSQVSAQNCGCDAALVKDKIEHSEEGFEYLYYLSQIESDEYEQLKKSASGNYKYKLIKASADYSDFKEKVKSEIRKTELETGRQYKSSYYESRTSPIAYEAWSQCMKLCTEKGLLLWISDEDENTIALKLRYNPPPNSSKINYTLEISHANGSSESKPDVIGLNEVKTIFVKRQCGSKNGHTKTFISVNGGGYSPDLTSKYYCGTPPPLPKLIEPPKPVLKSKIIVLTENQNCTEDECLGIKNIQKIEILSFKLGRRVSGGSNGAEEYSYNESSDPKYISKLKFGHWANSQCERKGLREGKFRGSGWHLPGASSCGSGQGDGIADVMEVKVKISYLE